MTTSVNAQHNIQMIIPIIPAKQYIEELREYAGMSDHDIAREAGLDRTTIWRLRHGKHKTTSHEPGIKIANLHARLFKRIKIQKKAISS